MMDDPIKLTSFDGQSIVCHGNQVLFEVGNFLGGGAAGNVYEAEHVRTRQHFAIKILNPLGYKLLSPLVLRKCTVVSKGEAYNEMDSSDKHQQVLGKQHIWWLVNGATKQFVAAYFSGKQNTLKECTLSQCVHVWGASPFHTSDDEGGNNNKDDIVEAASGPGGTRVYVPAVPPKFADFVRKRNRIFREIQNMRKIRAHVNVIRLEGVLELTQESKCTIFLVMELANGGELFDRIKLDCGAREATAKLFFQQLLRGVMHCHLHGVCHRDLKPENLLLQDAAESGPILKIADFGFSARFAMGDNDGSGVMHSDDWKGPMSVNTHHLGSSWGPAVTFAATNTTSTSLPDESLLRVLKSVVGSPFYVAPEVLQARGYDGPKADVWSLGVILYAMLAGNLPFEQELSSCKRFRLFCKWVREQTAKGVRFWNDQSIEYPQWLFPAKFSMLAKGLIVAMLHPDPDERISVSEAMRHPLCNVGLSSNNQQQQQQQQGLGSSIATISSLPVAVAAAAPTLTSAPNASIISGGSTEALTTSNMPIASAIGAGALNASVTMPPRSGLTQSIEAMNAAAVVVHAVCASDVMAITIGHQQLDRDVPVDAPTEDTPPMDLQRDCDIHDSLLEQDKPHLHSPSQDDFGCGDDDIMFLMEEDELRDSSADYPSSSDARNEQMRRSVETSHGESDDRTVKIPFPLPDSTEHNEQHVPRQFFDRFGGTGGDSVMHLTESPTSGTMRYLTQFTPPVAPMLFTSKSIDDLLSTGDVDEDSSPGVHTAADDVHGYRRGTSSSSPHVPTFSDVVKRSTRFITAVPAAEVLAKIETILERFKYEKTMTPIGVIGRLEMSWEEYRMEVWGADTSSPPLCALQLYQLPSAAAVSGRLLSEAASPVRFMQPVGSQGRPIPLSSLAQQGSPSPYVLGGRLSPSLPFRGSPYDTGPSASSPTTAVNAGSSKELAAALPQQLYLAEFIRGGIDIFLFKRFYQWLRAQLGELVKREFQSRAFESSSPAMESFFSTNPIFSSR